MLKNLVITLFLFSLAGCSKSDNDRAIISPNDISVKLSVDNPVLTLKKDFDLYITIENNKNDTIEIDTSPDEFIVPHSETSGGEYKQRGSRCGVSFTQNYKGQLGFFCTYDIKIPQQNSNTYFSIGPGKKYKLSFRLSPWGPVYSAMPAYASAGPAEITASLQLIINGNSSNIKAEPIKVEVAENNWPPVLP